MLITEVKKIDFVLISIIIILFVSFVASLKKSNDLNSENQELKIKEADLEIQLRETDAKVNEAIDQYEQRIAELQGNIDSSNTVISNLEQESSGLEAKIKSLEHAQISIKDKDELIQNLQSQVHLWTERFSLAQAEIAEKDKIIFSLTEQYESAKEIIIEKDKQILSRDELLVIKDLRIGGLEKQIEHDKFWNKIKTYGFYGSLIYIGIDVLTGLIKL